MLKDSDHENNNIGGGLRDTEPKLLNKEQQQAIGHSIDIFDTTYNSIPRGLRGH